MCIDDQQHFESVNVFGTGEPNLAHSEHFTGTSFLNPLTDPQAGELAMANVTFEPECRNNWHIHHAATGGGQVLVCTAGSGWYQQEGSPAVCLEPGSVVVIPTGAKHWRGAKKDSWFSHIPITPPGTEISNQWLETVSDEHHAALEN